MPAYWSYSESKGMVNTGLAKEFTLFFPNDGSSSTSLSLTSFETISLDCIVTAVIQCAFKKIKVGEFLCSHFNIEDGRKAVF